MDSPFLRCCIEPNKHCFCFIILLLRGASLSGSCGWSLSLKMWVAVDVSLLILFILKFLNGLI